MPKLGFRIGQGYDIHALVPGRALLLGGVAIEHEMGLLGHSDEDVLLHAVTDALLGALAMGDIGGHFPDHDPRYRGADSQWILQQVYGSVLERGWVLANLDSTLIAQRPKLARYIPAMRANLASLLQSDSSEISIKAKTNERFDAIGQGQAISAHVAVLLVPCDS